MQNDESVMRRNSLDGDSALTSNMTCPRSSNGKALERATEAEYSRGSIGSLCSVLHRDQPHVVVSGRELVLFSAAVPVEPLRLWAARLAQNPQSGRAAIKGSAMLSGTFPMQPTDKLSALEGEVVKQ